MLRPSTRDYPSVLPAEVWSYLSAEQRVKAIQYMAQLAFNLVKAQAHLCNQEANDVIRPDSPQNSQRSS